MIHVHYQSYVLEACKKSRVQDSVSMLASTFRTFFSPNYSIERTEWLVPINRISFRKMMSLETSDKKEGG